jgi:hypothetical protein
MTTTHFSTTYKDAHMANLSLYYTRHALLPALFIGLCLGISGCSPSVKVNLVEPVESQLQSEIIELRNCDCTEDLESDVDIQKQCEIDAYAYSTSQDEPILVPPDILAELETELELAYQPVYEMEKTKAGEIKLSVPPDKIRTFQIEWKELVYKSTVSFRMGFRTYSTPYAYVLKIPRENSYVEISCTA